MFKVRTKVLVVAAFVWLGSEACKKDDSSETATVHSKVRSTGIESDLLGLVSRNSQRSRSNGIIANSTFDIEKFEMPIFRINLVTDMSGSGYNSASPNFYTCPGSVPDDCLVDLTEGIDTDDILESGGETDVDVDGDTEYDGVALEYCADGSEGDTFNIVVQGSVDLDGTTYYTNADDGLSSTGPSEEVEIEADCHGVTTPLLEPVTLGPDNPVNIVLYADPNGAVVATNSKDTINSNCVGEDDLAICAADIMVFGTVDTKTPTVERYYLDVTDTDSDGIEYADMLLTTLFNSDDEPIGGTLQQLYTNTTQSKLMHSLQFNFSSVDQSDDVLTFNYWKGDGSSEEEIISDFARDDDTGQSISELVDEEVSFDVTKL